MSLGPKDQEYVEELLRKERDWLRFTAPRHRTDDDQVLLMRADAIDMYLRNGGPQNLVPFQAQQVIYALDHAQLITPVACEANKATWEAAVTKARVELLPYTQIGRRVRGTRFKRG